MSSTPPPPSQSPFYPATSPEFFCLNSEPKLDFTKLEPAEKSPLDLNSVELDMEDYNLAAATLMAEATGSQMPIVKEEIRYKIQNKRKKLGLNELKAEYKPPMPEVLCPLDEDRRRRRKASNRKAAQKCREKKKKAAAQFEIELKYLQVKNNDLQQQVLRLESEKQQVIKEWNEHRQCCIGTVDKSSPPPQYSPESSCTTTAAASSISKPATLTAQHTMTLDDLENLDLCNAGYMDLLYSSQEMPEFP